MNINASANRNTTSPSGCNPFRNFILVLPAPLTLFAILLAFHLLSRVLCHVGQFMQSVKGVIVLGHVQRGGSPTPCDRILSTRFGVAATHLVANGQFGRMVCLKAGKMASVSLDEALEKMKFIDPPSEIVRAARSVEITLGDSA